MNTRSRQMFVDMCHPPRGRGESRKGAGLPKALVSTPKVERHLKETDLTDDRGRGAPAELLCEERLLLQVERRSYVRAAHFHSRACHTAPVSEAVAADAFTSSAEGFRAR